jgi:hypothetical protein
MILQNVAGTSADVFLNCSFNYIGFILPQASKTILFDSKIVETPIVIAILGTFAVPLKSDEASTRVI